MTEQSKRQKTSSRPVEQLVSGLDANMIRTALVEMYVDSTLLFLFRL